MSYRLLRVTNFYKEYLTRYYEKNQDQDKLNYTEQYNHLINDSIESVSSYSKYLRKIGVDAIDLVTNATLLQNTWAKENNIPQDLNFKEFIIEQIKFYKPDILWIDDTRLLNKAWIEFVRKEIPTTKLIVGHICAPYNNEMQASFLALDLIFTCSPCTQKELTKQGCSAHLIYHSFDHSVINNSQFLEKTEPELDFVFTGSLYTGIGLHKTRIEYIEKMLESGINISLFGNLEPRSNVLLKQTMHHTIRFLNGIKFGFLTNKIPVIKKYQEYGKENIKYYSKQLINAMHPPVFGLDMYNLLSNSKLCFNIHGDVAGKCGGNIRLFEATGIGTCLVTDWKDNMPDLFDCEKEIVTYTSEEDCIDKVKWLLNNPKEVQKISKAGQERTLRDHTIEKRSISVNEILKSKL